MNALTEKEMYKILRKRKKITLKEVGKHIGLSDVTVCLWENDKRDMTEEQIKKYIEYIQK